MIEVKVDGDFESALIRLKREVNRDGIHRMVKSRERYPNLNDRKRQKAREAEGMRLGLCVSDLYY